MLIGRNVELSKEIYNIEDDTYNVFDKLTEEQEKAFWFPNEIPVSLDKQVELTSSEEELLKKTISYFNFSELIVQKVLVHSVAPFTVPKQATSSFAMQSAVESVHHRFFQMAANTFGITDETMKKIVLGDSHLKYKQELIIQAADKVHKYAFNSSEQDFRKSVLKTLLLNNVIQEGIFFYSAFAYFFAMRAIEGKLTNFVSGVDLVLRDESLHLQNGIEAIKFIFMENQDLLEDVNFIKEIYDLLISSVQVELDYLKKEFGGSTIFGVTSSELELYMKYILDRRLQELGFDPAFNIQENPLKFLESQDVETLNNFFETSVDYENK